MPVSGAFVGSGMAAVISTNICQTRLFYHSFSYLFLTTYSRSVFLKFIALKVKFSELIDKTQIILLKLG